MSIYNHSSAVLLGAFAVAASAGAQTTTFTRPPAVPLIAHDPYFSVWSTDNALTGGVTRHWTGSPQPLSSLIRIDGKTYRLMGNAQKSLPALPQTGVEVRATRTIYTFQSDAIKVQVAFTSPLLPENLEVFSRPATYVTWDVESVDAKTHDVSVYFEASGLLAVNEEKQSVLGATLQVGDLKAAKIGSQEQEVLGKTGDDLRIDWGHLLVATPEGTATVQNGAKSAEQFAQSGSLPEAVAKTEAQPASQGLAASVSIPFGKVSKTRTSKHAIIAYDDVESIQFFERNLPPYWRRNGATTTDLLNWAERDYASLITKCDAFDSLVRTELEKAGGANYAKLGELAYRQCFAAQKVVADQNGQPLMFSKENFSNGCIATVDVLYPAAPAMLLFSPTLMKASLVPLMEYSASPRWKFPFAPHDIGTYPQANGQVYGGGEQTEDNQMPVEESGNMIILLAALAKIEGNADFSAKYWPQISKWAAYLADKGFDPESQLSTDDFAGHLAHNVNLSAKAIEALAAYAYLAELRGLSGEATQYKALAQKFANQWQKEALDKDHYKLAFDKPGTWSQKYNLIWDRILGQNLFPRSVFRTELAYYRTKMNTYGLPLDSRADYTKLDWTVWTASLTGDRKDFVTLTDPILRFLQDTPDRVPMTDWYHTERSRKTGFQARSVVGGVFIKLLDDPEAWKKFASRDQAKVSGWAAIPKPASITEVVATAKTATNTWSYTTTQPTGNWYETGYSTEGWKQGPGGFGTSGTPGAIVKTNWDGNDIWIRRTFDLPTMDFSLLSLYIHHDEDAEIYVNGVLAGKLGGYTAKYVARKLPEAVTATLKPTGNVIAIHCHQTTGGQYIDAGLAVVKSQD